MEGKRERERRNMYCFRFKDRRGRAGTRRSVAGRCQPSYSNSLTDTRIRAGCREKVMHRAREAFGILIGQLIKDRMQVCQVFLFCFGFYLLSCPKCVCM